MIVCKFSVKSQNKKAKKELIRAMRKFERKLAENIRSDAKSFYAYVRSMSVSRVKPTCLQQQDGTNTSTPEQTCDSFNDYFFSVFTSESMDSIEQPPLVFHGSEKEAENHQYHCRECQKSSWQNED